VERHTYRPRGSAAEIFRARDAEVLMSGPAGTGKSRACLEKLNIQALKYPGMRGAIVRKTQVSLGSTALKTWRNDVVRELLASGEIYFYGGSAEEPPQYRYRNGSTIMVIGMDKPTRILSSEYDTIYVQEAIELTVTDWEAITTRLRNGVIPYQQLIADCNPDFPSHWLKKRCDVGTTRMINCRHEDNPVLFDEDGRLTEKGEQYIGKLDNLTGVRKQRLRYGQWASAEGVIYDGFNPAVHIIPRFEIPDDWARYWSVDFGFTNPFVCQFWAEDPDGRLYLYREIFRTQRTVDQHARDILSVVAPGGEWIEPKPQNIVTDHDSENRTRFEQELGIGTDPADKRVLHGIELVQARLRPAADGKPRLFLMPDAVVELDQELIDSGHPASTLEEMPGYIWLPETGTTGKKEQPRKLDDHGMDAMRYLVVERDPSNLPGLRFM